MKRGCVTPSPWWSVFQTYIHVCIFPPLIVLWAPMGGLVCLVVRRDLLFLLSLCIKELPFFRVDLADSSLRMSSIDLLSDLSWSALNSRLIDSRGIPRERTDKQKWSRRCLRINSGLHWSIIVGLSSFLPGSIATADPQAGSLTVQPYISN